MSLEAYRDEQLQAFRKRLDDDLMALRATLRENAQAFFDVKAAQLRQSIDRSSARTVAKYNAQMQKMNEICRNMPPHARAKFEEALKKDLKDLLAFYESLYDQFVESCKPLLK